MSHEKSNKSLSRRSLLLGAGGIAAVGAGAVVGVTALKGTATGAAIKRNSLIVPPQLAGTEFNLRLAQSSRQFFSGRKTPTYGFNGQTFWGPTMRWRHGDRITLNVTNQLKEITTAHWHGIHLPATADGGPHQPINPGATWSPSFTVDNDAATYWYHPHMHELTQKQLTMGAGGFIIIDDGSAASAKLPRTYGVDDIPLVLTSRRFLASNAFDTSKDVAYGDYLLTNGVLNATKGVPAQVVRLRILNAEVERYYNIGFSNDRPFYVVGTDGGLVAKPVRVTRLRMAPGERYEILIDLSHDKVGTELEMKAFNKGMPFGAGGSENGTSGPFGSLLNNTTFTLLHFVVGKTTTNGVSTVPTSLAATTLWTNADATNRRTINITDNGPGTPFTFDGQSYDMMSINQSVTLGSTEAWTIKNDHIFGHSFHIHDVQFSIVARSSGPVPDYEKGWKDTFAILPDESVTFVARFSDYADPVNPFMYHCHMSNHEDGGLMGQFLVLKS